MGRLTKSQIRNGLAAFVFGVALCTFVNCATTQPTERTGGETHFLKACDNNASCGDATACMCGICTRPCTDNNACQSLAASAQCVSGAGRPEAAVCQDSPLSSFCDAPCSTDESCRALSSALHCESGFCRSNTNVADAAICVRGQVTGSEVLLVGDALLASHQVTTDLQDLAHQAGSLGASDLYRDNSSIPGNSLALTTPNIASQYVQGQASSPVKVVIMDGGGADVLGGTCSSPVTASCPLLVNAAVAAEQLLAQMAQEGVQQVVYFFYADHADPVVLAKTDLLRPLIQSACENSPVPCHWLDLRPTYAGHSSEYIQADGISPTNAGAAAIAAAIWATMQQNCVAQ